MTESHLQVLHAHTGDDAAPVRQVLEGLGHRVEAVRRFGAALDALERVRPQLLIVDAAFDGERGREFIAQARASRHAAWTPILMTTDRALEGGALRRAIESGADDVVAKPLAPDALELRLVPLQRIAAALSGLHGVIDNVLEAVILIDGEGIVRAFNPAAERVFGYTSDEVVGRNVSLLMPSPFRDRHDGYIRRFLETREPRIIGVGRQVTARRKNGEPFPAHLAVSAISGSRRSSFVGLVRDLSAEQERERLLHLALHDPLTGLANRAQLLAAVAEEVRRAQGPFGLLFIDVDDFKAINDRWGHAIGDAVLSTIAGRLVRAVSRRDLVARLAGDEFVVLLRALEDEAMADAIAARVREAVGSRIVLDACSVDVRVSVGVALHGRDGDDVDSLLEAADHAMYRAKRASRGSASRAPAS